MGIPHSPFPIPHSERGIALLIVVSVLTVVAILGVSFMFSMYLETQASRQFSSTAQARYLAEAGVTHARVVLDEDGLGSRGDDLTEGWVTQFDGDDVDVDGTEPADATWWLLSETAGDLVGRYAVRITDESGKVNLNTAVASPAASGVDAPDLTGLLESVGAPDAAALAAAIERYRYGEDGKPGVALVDDDRDGAVDEIDEYQVLALRGDDRQIGNLEEVLALGELDATQFRRLATVATVYSWDRNLSLTGKPRTNLSTASADELLSVLLEAGAEDPWQMAANMADYSDPDLTISRLSKTASRYRITNQGDLGDWRWQTDPVEHYATEVPNGEPLVWVLTVPSGSFQVLLHGVSGAKVGDVNLQGQIRRSMDAGESFGVIALTGALTVQVSCGEPEGVTCAFEGLELVPVSGTAGLPTVVVRGVEAIRFNELMIHPVLELDVQQAVFDPQASGWICVGGGACQNSLTGAARWSWTVPTVQQGRYHVRVYGSATGQTVGEVRVDSQTAALVHGERHPATGTVGSDQKISVTIGKTPADGTYYFQKLQLSLQPDAEYVELINLSDEPLDVSGMVMEGEATRGRQARLPEGSIVPAHGLLVAAVDADDGQPGLAGNGIDVRSAWEVPIDADVVQLEFPGGELTPDADWLSVTMPAGTSAQLVLRDGEQIVDEIEYPVPTPTAVPFQSLEKGDPAVVRDGDLDGLDEDWYPSLKLYTPGTANDNEGLRELRGLEQIVHDPAEEVTILNRALESVGELAGLPSGIPWQVVTTADLAKIVDLLTVEGLRLEAEGHLVEAGAWRETTEGSETSVEGTQGTWQWRDVPDGQYRLNLYGWGGEQASVRWQLAGGSYSEWTPPLSTDTQGRINVGQVTVGLDVTPANVLTLQVRCESVGGICHLSHLVLDPQLRLMGMINVNTAPREVLLSLPGMTPEVADRLSAGRPYGDQESKGRGIGDLLIGSALGVSEEEKLARFRQFGGLLTVRSQLFQILSLGEALERERPMASQRIQAIIQRQ